MASLTFTTAAEATPFRGPAVPRKPNVRADGGTDDAAGLGYDTRNDRCLAGQLLNWGEVETKTVAGSLLDGPEATLRQAVEGGLWSYGGPLGDAKGRDEKTTTAYLEAWNARYKDWENALDPLDKYWFAPEKLWHAPEFGDPIRQYLIHDIPFRYRHPEASDAAMEQAKKVAETADEQDRNVFRMLGATHGPDDIRSFIQRGGYPKATPEAGTVEFRTEVEAVKARWAGCDVGTPFDPYHVLGPVIRAAHAEWQAELAGQAKARTAVVTAQIAAVRHLRTATDAMVKASGQAWVADGVLQWQKYQNDRRKAGQKVPDAAVFRQADAILKDARNQADAEAKRAEQAATAAKGEGAKVTAAQDEAGKAADAIGAPRGRGLEYAQQAAQIARASVAATEAAATSARTASHATGATVQDSKTLAALAETQAHAVQAEYHRAAAQEAAAQAKAAADSAGRQAAEAKGAMEKAEAAKATAEKAEATARDAAKDASEKRAVAERERDNAKKYRADADARHKQAEEADKRAQEQKARAAEALGRAQGLGRTVDEKARVAEAAEEKASTARRQAEDAERRKSAAESRAKALEAAAAAAEGTGAAGEARSAANEAKAEATAATDAASKARKAADDATSAAVAAREDAVKANGAAVRARAASDAAASDAATTRSALATAHAAAAEAIEASEQAARNVRNAEKEAKKAAEAADTARKEAEAARSEARKADATSAEAVGHAHATAQAAAAARDSAADVARPAAVAIGLGGPYQEKDASAGLSVIVGQTAKTLAEQQAAAAQAKADEAARAAKEAKELAAKANRDAKAAAEAAAEAADDAARAARYVAEARGYAARAKAAAEAAQRAEANTNRYNEQAHKDAYLADAAAGTAESEAAAARNSADEAEKDAGSARQAAGSAERDASAARDSAAKSDRNATSAEQAAEHARDEATRADQAATRAEAEERARQEAARKKAMETGSTGVSGGGGPDLGADDESVLLRVCGRACLDEYRGAQKAASMSVVDWVKENGGEILLEVLGVDNVKRCFGEGDVESCLWSLVDAAGWLTVIAKIKPIGTAIFRVATGISAFFEKAQWGKRTTDRLRKLIERGRKTPDRKPPVCVVPSARFGFAPGHRAAAAAQSADCMPPGLTDKSEQYVRSKHFDGGSLVDRTKGLFNESVDLDELADHAAAFPARVNDRGNFERVVDFGKPVGETSAKDGARVTSWFMLVQDQYGGIITMYPIPPA
ncbi:hypothetical protein ABT104_07780 [Streptomyces mobaraensis]|uniref:hypothetical protein n=1 Tax=Streptomyces mobaraensis TaxID=35621 RepID=UPI00331A8954